MTERQAAILAAVDAGERPVDIAARLGYSVGNHTTLVRQARAAESRTRETRGAKRRNAARDAAILELAATGDMSYAEIAQALVDRGLATRLLSRQRIERIINGD